MKILSIRIKNLASLAGEHFIDFESEPLASTGLIAIIGKTGAGKSTILDAMCLALFNRIPRLKDSDGKIKDADGSEIASTAPQTVLRKGSSNGFAEVEFLAQDQKIYQARWELKRAKDKTDGKLQKIQRALICVTDENKVLASSATQVEKELRSITHLTFEQFTRAVLLAQSEVTAFLKARDAERGELLEYLTNSNIFGKIGELAFRKTAEITKKRKEIENVIGHISLLSEEELTTLTTEHTQTEQQCQQLEQQLQHLKTQQQWFVRQVQLQDDINKREQYHQEALHQYQQLESSKQSLQQLDRFAEIRAVVQQQQEFLRQQQQLTPQLKQSEQSFQKIKQQFDLHQQVQQHASEQFKQAREFAEKHEKTLQQIREGVQKRIAYGEQYKVQKSELEQLQYQYTPLNSQIQQQEQHLVQLQQQNEQLQQQLNQQQFNVQFDKGLETHIANLNQFIQQYQPLYTKHGHFNQLEAQLKQNQKEYAQLLQKHGDTNQIEQQIQSLQANKEQLLQQRHHVDVIGEQLQKWLDQQQDLIPLRQNIDEMNHQHAQMIQQVQQAEQQLSNAQTAREQLQQLLQQQRLIHTENVEKLRELLVPEQPCMVCGSNHHPYMQNQDAISKSLFDLQQQQEQQALEHEKTCLTHLNHHKDLLQKHQLQLAEHEKEATLLEQHIEKMRLELTQHIKIADINLNVEQPANVLLQQFSDTQKIVQQQLQQLEQQLNQLNFIQKQQQQLAQQQQHLQHAHQHMQQLHGQIHLIIDALSAEQKHDWQTDPMQMSQHLLSTLQARLNLLNQFEQLNAELEKQQQDHQAQKIQANHLLNNIDKAQQKLNDITQQAKDNTTNTLNLLQSIATIASEQQPHEWLSQYDAGFQQIQQHYQQTQQQFEQQRMQFDAEQQQLNILKSQSEQLAQQLKQSTYQIDLWLAQNPDFNTDLIVNLNQISHDDIQKLRGRIQQTELSYQNAVTALNTMREELDKHQQSAPSIHLNVLEQQLLEQQEALAKAKGQAEAIKISLEMHQQELNKQQKFADQIAQIKQEEDRWNKISSVMGDATGKKFRDYAQQYHLDILLEYANQQLQQLSQRYTLKRLENSLSLAIIDHDMDGEVRSVASLSGGESFLTALALSLAIANMASGDLKIESLFIDEGFGTLDPSSLHMVMNALDKLQSQGRKVVLISHIQEMHERIPVQIQVQPQGNGSSRIQVVG